MATAPGCTIRPTTSTTKRSRWGRPTGRGWWRRRYPANNEWRVANRESRKGQVPFAIRHPLFANDGLLADDRFLARHAGAAGQHFGEPVGQAAPERELIGARVFQRG